MRPSKQAARRVRAFPLEFTHRRHVDPATHCEGCGRPALDQELACTSFTDSGMEIGVYGIPDGGLVCGAWSNCRDADDAARELRDRIRHADIHMSLPGEVDGGAPG